MFEVLFGTLQDHITNAKVHVSGQKLLTIGARKSIGKLQSSIWIIFGHHPLFEPTHLIVNMRMIERFTTAGFWSFCDHQ